MLRGVSPQERVVNHPFSPLGGFVQAGIPLFFDYARPFGNRLSYELHNIGFCLESIARWVIPLPKVGANVAARNRADYHKLERGSVQEILREGSLVFLHFEVVLVFGKVFGHRDKLVADGIPPVQCFIGPGTDRSGSLSLRLNAASHRSEYKQYLYGRQPGSLHRGILLAVFFALGRACRDISKCDISTIDMKVKETNEKPLSPAALHILLALSESDLHGYGIMQAVKRQSGGEFKLGPGTLYSNLDRLLASGLVGERERKLKGGELRREYYLMASGERALRVEIRRLRRVVAVAKGRLGEEGS
jgi:DNA-binding PadR family transcriptional regulator